MDGFVAFGLVDALSVATAPAVSGWTNDATGATS